jgi:hypothetical protein
MFFFPRMWCQSCFSHPICWQLCFFPKCATTHVFFSECAANHVFSQNVLLIMFFS